ncbi:MAG: YezD family protein [Elusimicrobia bacterium]|nr:YezD family protein [Elusimicrobiota bacterium]
MVIENVSHSHIERENMEVYNEIKKAIEKIKFGEIVITIHDGKVVQIEKREKKRFDIGARRR